MALSGGVPVSGCLGVPEHLFLLTNPRPPMRPDPAVPTVLFSLELDRSGQSIGVGQAGAWPLSSMGEGLPSHACQWG